MKNIKNSKIFALVIALALLVCSAVAIGVSAEGESAENASLSIYKKNVSFQNSPQLVFAVAYENCDPSDITLNVWYGEKSGDAQVVEAYGNATIEGKSYPAFAVNPQNPKDIDALVYVQAVCGSTVSEVERYSILEYAWSGIMNSDDNADAARYASIITYSESIQVWLKASGKFDGALASEFFYVKAEGADLDESGYDSGIFTSPVTFTLGESALGWNVVTYKDGVKTAETKAGGSTVTASASTICTKIEEIKPQAVEGNPLDYENLIVPSNGNAGAGTTFAVGSSFSSGSYGIEEVEDKNGNTTKAYRFDNNAASGTFRFQAYGDDTKAANLANANAFIFETDMRIVFNNTSDNTVEIKLGSTGTSNSFAYFHTLRRHSDGTIKFLDTGAGGNGGWVYTSLKSGDWFNFRIEYYKISADELLALTFVDGELIYASNRPQVVNSNGDDAWPVYSASFTENSGKSINGIEAIFIKPNSGADMTFYFDNTLLRRTTLTPPAVPESLYTSKYTPAN